MSGISGMTKRSRGRDPVRVQHGVEVVDEFGPVGLRDTGQDHAEGGLAVPGVLQDLPDRPVGVPAGAGHEQPQVRGVEELVGELVVRLHHRVDVRRIKQRDAARHALARREHEQPVPAGPGQAFLPDPGQRGQEVVLGEPVDLVGVAGQDRAVRRRPAHAGGAHVRADDAVHQRGLPGAGGADQGDEHRRGGAAHPGQQVVVDLAEELAAFDLDLGGTGDLEDERDGGDPLPEVEQGGFEQACVDPDVRLSGGLDRTAAAGRGQRARTRPRARNPRRARWPRTARPGTARSRARRCRAARARSGRARAGRARAARARAGWARAARLRAGRIGRRGCGLGGSGAESATGSVASDGTAGNCTVTGSPLSAVGRHRAGHGPGLGRRDGREGICRLRSVYRGRREAGRGLVVARILIPCDSVIVSIRINNVIQFVRFNLLRWQFRLRLLG